jgi:cobalt-precorrin 5A hydrolase
MKIGIITFTSAGYQLGESLCEKLQAVGHKTELFRCGKDMLNDWTSRHFATDDALVFIGATGIAIRAVAPYLKSKTSDPAVVVIDELGRFVIPLLAGHIGGANRLAQNLAKLLEAIPVVTTATDCNNVFAIDTWASENEISIINPEGIKQISAKLLAGKTVNIKSYFPVKGKLPNGLRISDVDYDVIFTAYTTGESNVLRLIPPVLTLGIGCRKGVSESALKVAFEMFLEKLDCHKEAVCRVCSIDLKAQEGVKAGYIDEEQVVCETAASIFRAGAHILITYYALELAKWIEEERIG